MDLSSWILAVVHLVIAPATAGHALLYKRDPRAALGWITVCVLFPLAGPFAYYIFGVNRTRSRARRLAGLPRIGLRIAYERGDVESRQAISPPELPDVFLDISLVGDRVTATSLLPGNGISSLSNGEEAYPEMLAAIEGARERVFLSTYIFESNESGRQFIAALAAAHARGVTVKVLIDGVGGLYSWPRARRLLAREGVDVHRFLPPRLIPPSIKMNLRNHRKILTVDGEIAFTGGMNIGDRHRVTLPKKGRVRDLHFKLAGPVVADLEAVFCRDWTFTTGEKLVFEDEPRERGEAWCRVVSDGPDEDMDRLALLIAGAMAAADRQVLLVTPYFLPSRELVMMMQSAALRGLEVAIVLPERSNLRYVDWATRNMLWELLQYDVRIYLQPAPFDHSKLLVLDRRYTLIGSANIDPRSLRLNFELGVEVFDEAFSGRAADHIESLRSSARELKFADVEKRALPTRLRDAFCWLFSPYL